jgi:hypothetical protein
VVKNLTKVGLGIVTSVGGFLEVGLHRHRAAGGRNLPAQSVVGD